MYSACSNPWETAHLTTAFPPILATSNNLVPTYTGTPAAYDVSRKTLPVTESTVADEPWPNNFDSRSDFLSTLCGLALQQVYSVLEANASADSQRVCLPGLDDGNALPPPSRRVDDPLPPATARADANSFMHYKSFPSQDSKMDISLSAKLALVTPAHPDTLTLPTDDTQSLCKLIRTPNSLVSTEMAIRAARITTQWLRESFGDESMPRPCSSKLARKPSQPEVASESTTQMPGTAPANQYPFHCNACSKPMHLQSFRIRCAECEDFDLCETCFCEGREVQNHKREHYFIPIGPNQFPLLHPQWTADEDLYLLDSVGKFGFGNWQDVCDQVSLGSSPSVPVKTKEACEKRYFNFHLSSKQHTEDEFYPFSSLIRQPKYSQWKTLLKAINQMPEESRVKENETKQNRSTVSLIKPRIIKDADAVEPEDPSKIKIKEPLIMECPSLPPKTQIAGFLFQRGDFELEWENHAEYVIADLETRDNESPMEKEIKLRMLEYYNSILDDRIRRKKMVLEKKLYDAKLLQQVDRMRSPEEKSLHDLFKPLWKHFYTPYSETRAPLFTSDRKIRTVPPEITEAEIDELVHLLLEDDALVERLNKLTTWRKYGLKTLEEVIAFNNSNSHVNSGEGGAMDDSDSKVPKLQPGRRMLSELESEICDELQVREEFLIYIKKMIQHEIECSRQHGSINIDTPTGLKILQLEEGDIVPLNDFIVDAHIELDSELAPKEFAEEKDDVTADTDVPPAGLAIPRKRKLPSSSGGAKTTPQANAPDPLPSQPAVIYSVSEHSQAQPSLESMTQIAPALSGSPVNLEHPPRLQHETQNPTPLSYVSPLPSEICPVSPSSDSGLLETEEGEIEDDEETQFQKPPPPPPVSYYGTRVRPQDNASGAGMGKGGKGAKRARRGSGGLGLAPVAAPGVVANMESDDGSAGEGDGDSSQRKSISLLSSDLRLHSDEDFSFLGGKTGRDD